MDKNVLIEILNSNQGLLQDLSQSKFLQDNFMGLLRNIECSIPDACRDNFYGNLRVLRIGFANDRSFCLVNAPVICLDKRFRDFVDNHIHSNFGIDYEDELLKQLYHELLHIASNTLQIIDGKVIGAGGFQNIPEIKDGKYVYKGEEDLNGLTEGFTQYLTLIAFDGDVGRDQSNYTEQISSAQKLIEKVGLENMKKAYFDNRNGMELIECQLMWIGENPKLYLELEEQCHIPEPKITRKQVTEMTQDVKTSDIQRETQEISKTVKTENKENDIGTQELE